MNSDAATDPKMVAAANAAALIFGSVAASLFIDQFGLFDFPVQAVSIPRLCGVGCVLLGVALLQMGRP